VSATGATHICLALAAACCVAGLAAALALRRRLERVARAEHELRGPATALMLVCERMRRNPATAAHARVIEAQLDRLRAGLADLGAARCGRRVAANPESVELDRSTRAALEPWRSRLRSAWFHWEGGKICLHLDRGRLAQALGNLLANATEHGDGDLEIRGRASDGRVRVEVRNRASEPRRRRPAADRGRGLAIASHAANDLGGSLHFGIKDGIAVAALDLPVPAASTPEPRQPAAAAYDDAETAGAASEQSPTAAAPADATEPAEVASEPSQPALSAAQARERSVAASDAGHPAANAAAEFPAATGELEAA